MQTLLNKFARYQHIIWDWNGTLVDDAALTCDVVNTMLTENGLSPITLEEYRHRFCHPVIDFYTDIGLTEQIIPFKTLCQRFNTLYTGLRPQVTLHRKAYMVAQQIANGGHVQSVLSAAAEHLLKEQIAELGVTGLFDHIYGLNNMLAASKIERGQELIAHTGIDPQQTILVGDTDHDFEVAEALGTDLILIARGHQSYERLLALHSETLMELQAA